MNKEKRSRKKEAGLRTRYVRLKNKMRQLKSQISHLKFSQVISSNIALALIITLITLLVFIAQITGFSIYGTTDYGLSEVIGGCQNITTSGTYTLNQSVTTDAVCFSINATNVVLDGAGYNISNGTYGVWIVEGNKNNVTIKNFGGITRFCTPIKIDGTNNVTIYNNTIDVYDCSNLKAIDIFQSNSTNISLNTIMSTGIIPLPVHAIYVEQSYDEVIASNTIRLTGSNSVGTYLDNSHRTSITANTINITGSGNSYGIRLGNGASDGIQNVSIDLNTIFTLQNNEYGVYVKSTSGTGLNFTSNNIATQGNNSHALYIQGTNHKINLNTINTSGRSSNGIYLVSASIIDITSNTIMSFPTGLERM